MNAPVAPGAVEVAGPPTDGVLGPHGNPKLSNHEAYNVIGVNSMLLVLCFMAVAGRLKARRMTKARLSFDDYLALVALVLFISLCIQQYYLAYCLLTVIRIFPPDLAMLQTLAKVQVSSQINYIVLLTAARASILFLYRRIFGLTSRWFRIAWLINTFVTLAFCVALLISLAFECSPNSLDTLWKAPSQCGTSRKDPVIAGFLNALVDFVILILPVKMIWTLQMSPKRKLMVCGIFGLGLLGVAISIARAIAFINPQISTPGGAVSFAIWSSTEAAVALLCACLPLLRPIFTNAYQVISTFRSNSIASFGFRDTEPKSVRVQYLAERDLNDEDSMLPSRPQTSKGPEQRISMPIGKESGFKEQV